MSVLPPVHDRQSPPLEAPLCAVVVGGDRERRQSILKACRAAVTSEELDVGECADLPTLMFRLAANGIQLVILDEPGLADLPRAVGSMVTALSPRVTLLTVVATGETRGRHPRISIDAVGMWVRKLLERKPLT